MRHPAAYIYIYIYIYIYVYICAYGHVPFMSHLMHWPVVLCLFNYHLLVKYNK